MIGQASLCHTVQLQGFGSDRPMPSSCTAAVHHGADTEWLMLLLDHDDYQSNAISNSMKDCDCKDRDIGSHLFRLGQHVGVAGVGEVGGSGTVSRLALLSLARWVAMGATSGCRPPAQGPGAPLSRARAHSCACSMGHKS